MTKLIELNTDSNLLVSSKILTFDKPDYVYIPIKTNKILVKQNTKVEIGTILMEDNNIKITSPISGTIKAIKKVMTINGEENAIEIQNDFEEKSEKTPTSKRNLKNISTTKITNILKEYQIDLTKTSNLILNCLDDEPYVLTENFYLFLYYEGFLELLDKISRTYNISNITICVKSSSSENISKIMSYLGMYPNINLNIIPDLYLISKDKYLLEHLNLNNKDTTIIKASTFYNIYNLIKKNKSNTDKLITISGNGVSNPSIVKTKMGAKVIDILNNLINVLPNTEYLTGLMSGHYVDIADLIITNDLNSILIMKPKKYLKTTKCLKCGACLDVCPVNINPLLLSDATYYEKVKDICLKCGLCSYICPAHINFNEKGDNHV